MIWILYHSFHLCAILPVFGSLILVYFSYRLLFWIEANDELRTYATTSKRVVEDGTFSVMKQFPD